MALKELQCNQDEVDIEVLQEPSKGIFGLVKLAKVKVIPKPKGIKSKDSINREHLASVEQNEGHDAQERGRDVLDNILKKMGISNYEIKVRIEEDNIILDVKSESEGLLIGRHGKTREAIQYLVDRISNIHEKERNKYIIDIGGYLNRHKETLEKIAQRAAERVRSLKKEEHLEAMSAFDRRIIHLYLKDNSDIKTFSLGEGGFRHIVVAPQRNSEE